MCVVYHVIAKCKCQVRVFIDSIHWFDSLLRFLTSIHWFDSLIRFITSIDWSLRSLEFKAANQCSDLLDPLKKSPDAYSMYIYSTQHIYIINRYDFWHGFMIYIYIYIYQTVVLAHYDYKHSLDLDVNCNQENLLTPTSNKQQKMLSPLFSPIVLTLLFPFFFSNSVVGLFFCPF